MEKRWISSDIHGNKSLIWKGGEPTILQEWLERGGLGKVKDFWEHTEEERNCWQWKFKEWFSEWNLREELRGLIQELNKRKIDIRVNKDRIRWGY